MSYKLLKRLSTYYKLALNIARHPNSVTFIIIGAKLHSVDMIPTKHNEIHLPSFLLKYRNAIIRLTSNIMVTPERISTVSLPG